MRVLAVFALAVTLLALDLRRSAPDQVSARLTIAAIHLYQATLSRWYATMGVQCRFSPSCSQYAEACIREFGAGRGAWLAITRVLRCGPWTPAGTVDPAPRRRLNAESRRTAAVLPR
jgi:putative membrane protein insertion efficiency factor